MLPLLNSEMATRSVYSPLILCTLPHSKQGKWSDARAAWNFWIHERSESTRLKIFDSVTAI